VDKVEALHAAARRYAAERATAWENRYSDLRAEEEKSRQREGLPEPTTYSYSSEELATFPRYQVLHAIQAAVEAFTPADLGSLDEARELLAMAAAEAQSIFTRPPVDEIERSAMAEEREQFAQYVRGLSYEQLARIEPLPFRRTLAEAESARIWTELKNRWGVKGYWYPLDRAPDAEPPPHAQAFNADPFFDPELQQQLRDALAELDVSRVWEIRELDTDPDKEFYLALLEPVYTGAEGYWTDASLDWLMYASHEGSVTIAGESLLPELQRRWPNWRRHSTTALSGVRRGTRAGTAYPKERSSPPA
jgi:hypothetical protein